jgi:hypothetical protein
MDLEINFYKFANRDLDAIAPLYRCFFVGAELAVDLHVLQVNQLLHPVAREFLDVGGEPAIEAIEAGRFDGESWGLVGNGGELERDVSLQLIALVAGSGG